MSDRPKTASELMAELKSNPDFQRKRTKKESTLRSRAEHHERLLAPILAQLKNLGLQGASLQEMVNNASPLNDEAIHILLSGLSNLSDARVLESVIRALGAAASPFDGRPLVQCYENTDDDALKWAILNTISLARPHSIDQWLYSLVNTPGGDTLRQLTVE